jgi:hypothetical protein
MALDLVPEEPLEITLGRLVAGSGWRRDVERIETGPAPGLLVGLHDEGAQAVADRIGVRCEHAVLVALVHEGQPLEGVRGAEPHELRAGDLGGGAEGGAVLVAQPAVGAIGEHHQVIAAQLGQVAHLVLEAHLDAGVARALLQQPQQRRTPHGRHAVACAPLACPSHPHLDAVPAATVLAERLAQDRVSGIDRAQRRVGEHDAEAEGVLGPVALKDDDLGVRQSPLDEGGEEQAAGAGADAGEPQAHETSSTGGPGPLAAQQPMSSP